MAELDSIAFDGGDTDHSSRRVVALLARTGWLVYFRVLRTCGMTGTIFERLIKDGSVLDASCVGDNFCVVFGGDM